MSGDEVADVWAATRKMGYPWGPFNRLALLTWQRREEVAALRWSQLAPDFSLWTLPAKGDKTHIVHLAEPVREILRQIPRIRGSDLVFTMTGKTPVSGFSKAKRALDAAIIKARNDTGAKFGREPEPLQHWVLHDFRRTGTSMLAERGFDSIALDKILSHQPTKLRGVAKIYHRCDFPASASRRSKPGRRSSPERAVVPR